MEVQKAIEDCLIHRRNFYEVPAIVDFRDANRDDWAAVAEDEAYPGRADLADIRYH